MRLQLLYFPWQLPLPQVLEGRTPDAVRALYNPGCEATVWQ